ncbi:MAG: PDZ domain-containing protein, partial [Xanthomonadales bacterium]|nr:PDZ domain-containing protein [Xanthomonadales bacterium]
MKPTLLATALLLAMHGAVAADPAPAAPADKATDRAAAREELAELRTQIAELSRRMADLSVELGDVGPRAYAFRYITDPDRAIIGVVLASEARGARIEALTPDGPAERAGLRSGDVITAIDGKALAGGDAEAKLDDARERLAGLKDGQDVRIGYERDGKAGKELRIAAQRRAARNWPTLIADDDGPSRVVYERQVRDGMKQVEVEMARAHAEAARAGVEAQRAMSEADRARLEAGMARLEALRDIRPGWDINLTSLNPELGRYFGTDSGVLVLSAGSDALAGLKAGDVIRKVEGRPITRPEEALRALRDEPTGSEVELDVLRERKSVALKVKVPEHRSIFRIGRAAALPALAPPAPPSPPTPPAA